LRISLPGIDAYKTAHALELGQPVPDPFGFERMFGPTPQYGTRSDHYGVSSRRRRPTFQPLRTLSQQCAYGRVVLIGLGVLFMLHTVGVFDYDIGRYWSLILSSWAVGCWRGDGACSARPVPSASATGAGIALRHVAGDFIAAGILILLRRIRNQHLGAPGQRFSW